MENKNTLLWVVAADALDDYFLRLTFNDGCVKLFDCKPLIKQYKAYSPLLEEKTFHDISLDGWTVTWKNGTIDVAPEYLYDNSSPLYDVNEGPAELVAEKPVTYKTK